LGITHVRKKLSKKCSEQNYPLLRTASFNFMANKLPVSTVPLKDSSGYFGQSKTVR